LFLAIVLLEYRERFEMTEQGVQMKHFKLFKSQNPIAALVISLAFILSGASGFAAETEKKPEDKHSMTQEKRNQMADSMEKMAACMRSDKPMETCHDEMRQRCQDSEDSCPMMGKMGKGMHGMMMGKGMKNGKKDSETNKKESEEHTEHH
jgi:hypothetical protein